MSSLHSPLALPPRITISQYLAMERASPLRHEFFDGRLVAMAGESLPHGIIAANTVAALVAQLKGTPCFVVTKDTKVRSGLGLVSAESTSGTFSYPDILVVCGEPAFLDAQRDVIMNPTVILEVLSKSTETLDRGEKFQRYRAWNPTLKDYVLIAQSRPITEHFHRQPDNTWNMEEAIGLEAKATIATISCTLALSDIYDRIEFAWEN